MAASGDDMFRQALALLQAGQLADAERQFRAVLAAQPHHVAVLNLLSMLLTQRQQYAEAEPYIKRALELNSRSDASFYNYGVILKALNRPEEAHKRFSQALEINSQVADTWNNRGVVSNDLKCYDDAIADFDRAIKLQPNYPEAYCNKGRSLAELRRHDDALSTYRHALALNPDFAEAWLGCGHVFKALKRTDEAFDAYDKALRFSPGLADGWLGRGDLFMDQMRYDDARLAYERALALKPDLAEAWLGRANISKELKRLDEAAAFYDKALAIKPDFAEAWLGRGNLLRDLGRHGEALAAYNKALALKSDLAEAWLGSGAAYSETKQFTEAFRAYDKALTLKPDLIGVEGARLNARLLLCDWSNLDADCEHLVAAVRKGQANTQPFALLALPVSPADQLQCAKVWVATEYPAAREPLWHEERYAHDRIRVGYLSADFRQHVVASLIVGMLECHDRSRFDVTAVSLGPKDTSDLRRRLEGAVEHFVDVEGAADEEIARRIKALEIDVLVDLMGFTAGSRPGILARRPAPIQVSFLGYLGTMGAPYIDYIVADRTVVPEAHREFYSERVVYLPHCFQPTDRKRPIADKSLSRPEAGLPESGFVFCCFNGSYKITPPVFDHWMRILQRVAGSVLWLVAENQVVRANLQREAAARGVDAGRLVFAAPVSLPEHQARLPLADLFLDTWPYNAGATASDTLWAGVPLLTRLGETFVGRMAASVLQAIGLPELVTATPEAYEALAVELATNPARSAAIKLKLANNRLTMPLFDTALYTGHIEAAYAEMCRHRRPENISVSA